MNSLMHLPVQFLQPCSFMRWRCCVSEYVSVDPLLGERVDTDGKDGQGTHQSNFYIPAVLWHSAIYVGGELQLSFFWAAQFRVERLRVGPFHTRRMTLQCTRMKLCGHCHTNWHTTQEVPHTTHNKCDTRQRKRREHCGHFRERVGTLAWDIHIVDSTRRVKLIHVSLM